LKVNLLKTHTNTVRLVLKKKKKDDEIQTTWMVVLLLLYAHRYRSILEAAGHIILTPANQLMVMELKIWSVSNPGSNLPYSCYVAYNYRHHCMCRSGPAEWYCSRLQKTWTDEIRQIYARAEHAAFKKLEGRVEEGGWVGIFLFLL
jgi:hypothetical protein